MSSISVGAAGQDKYGTVRAGQVPGTNTNDSATTGFVGEFISSLNSNVTLVSTNTYAVLTSITLTAGEWEIFGTYATNPQNGTVVASTTNGANNMYDVAISSTSASNAGSTTTYSRAVGVWPASFAFTGSHSFHQGHMGGIRVSISATTQYYINGQCSYTGTAPQMTGSIYARRIR